MINRKGKTTRQILQYILMAAFAIFFLFPIVFMFVSSLKNNEMQIISDMSSLKGFIPYGDIGLQNYKDVFHQMNFSRFMFNSVFITSSAVLLGLVVNSLIAFSLARLKFRGRKLLVAGIVALMIIPNESVVIPLLFIVNKFGWIDSYHVQIIPYIADPFSIFLFYQFFISLPKALDEAARMDGAGSLQVFLQIVAPLSKPIYATVAILQGIMRWGDFLWPLIVTRGEKYRPLPIAIQQFFSQDPKVWGDIFAFSSMITIPLLVLFLVFQKWFIQSVASSGIKS